ncbi:MAG TPA: hypothetical protein VFQ14_05620 [Thermoleophilaceae bacterium]|nr:hypothetical protein [Thermoleophilaceae bacterium]
MKDPKVAIRAIAYVAVYAGGLALSYVHFGGSEEILADALTPVMVWSLVCGLVTVRFEALMAPAGVIAVGVIAWIASTDGVIVYSYDTGPITLLFYPLILGFVTAALIVPMGIGIVVARLLQPERVARSQSPLASLDEIR